MAFCSGAGRMCVIAQSTALETVYNGSQSRVEIDDVRGRNTSHVARLRLQRHIRSCVSHDRAKVPPY
jgi:hypothetical protein